MSWSVCTLYPLLFPSLLFFSAAATKELGSRSVSRWGCLLRVGVRGRELLRVGKCPAGSLPLSCIIPGRLSMSRWCSREVVSNMLVVAWDWRLVSALLAKWKRSGSTDGAGSNRASHSILFGLKLNISICRFAEGWAMDSSVIGGWVVMRRTLGR